MCSSILKWTTRITKVWSGFYFPYFLGTQSFTVVMSPVTFSLTQNNSISTVSETFVKDNVISSLILLIKFIASRWICF